MHVACIHAHPDDAEILAGGTLALLAASGNKVTIVSMTAGDCGTGSVSPKEISIIRQREAAAAAKVIGAEYQCAKFRDIAIFNDDESRRRVTELIRKLRPDVILTASPADYHCDHEATSVLVRDACFAASVPNYSTNAKDPAPPLHSIRHLYFVDSIAGVDRMGSTIQPDFVVNVKTTFKAKRLMLSAHESQREWLKRQHGIEDPIQTMERWTRARGKLAGVDFGEGFRRYNGHPFPDTPLLEDLLGAKAVGLGARG
jgi:LmbE family N-acetylglucosaminyl deacetylase